RPLWSSALRAACSGRIGKRGTRATTRVALHRHECPYGESVMQARKNKPSPFRRACLEAGSGRDNYLQIRRGELVAPLARRVPMTGLVNRVMRGDVVSVAGTGATTRVASQPAVFAYSPTSIQWFHLDDGCTVVVADPERARALRIVDMDPPDVGRMRQLVLRVLAGLDIKAPHPVGPHRTS